MINASTTQTPLIPFTEIRIDYNRFANEHSHVFINIHSICLLRENHKPIHPLPTKKPLFSTQPGHTSLVIVATDRLRSRVGEKLGGFFPVNY